MPEGDSLSICIRLLGRFEIMCSECVLRPADWTHRKPAALLACLAIKRRLTKDQAIDLFWPDNDLHSGANKLYRTLHELRQTLNKFLGPGSAELVLSFEDGILFWMNLSG
jgi:DNA-binding SARP family transcriptional activator